MSPVNPASPAELDRLIAVFGQALEAQGVKSPDMPRETVLNTARYFDAWRVAFAVVQPKGE